MNLVAPASPGTRELPPVTLGTGTQTFTLRHGLGVTPRILSASLRSVKDQANGVGVGMEFDLAGSDAQNTQITIWRSPVEVVVTVANCTVYWPDGTSGTLTLGPNWELIVRVSP